jgi:transcriptional antiterminator RfaH
MGIHQSPGGVCWYVIHTKPKQEAKAQNNLSVWEVETFTPMLKEIRKTRAGGQYFLAKPLFPQYIFARFDINALLHKVSFTRGVHSVLCYDNEPAPVDDDLIAILRSRVRADGFIHLGEEFKPGDKVLIKEGRFKNFIGIFDRELKESARVRILLTTISFQSHITVERAMVKKAGSAV